MIIINAHINQIHDFDDFETEIVRKDVQAIGIDDYIDVGSVSHLLSELERFNGQPILLFTNFSPNYFFKKRGVDVNQFQIKPLPNRRVEQYSFSAGLYHHICKKYSIVEVHFITSALKRVVNDFDLLGITDGIFTTIQRKHNWLLQGVGYEGLLKADILMKAHEATENAFLAYPNYEQLLRNPVIKFCQN